MATKQELLRDLLEIQRKVYDFGQKLTAEPESFEEETSTAYVGGYVATVGIVLREIENAIEALR